LQVVLYWPAAINDAPYMAVIALPRSVSDNSSNAKIQPTLLFGSSD
jgi:hypothetical protein